MLKRDYLLKALNAGAYKDAQWVIHLLCHTQADPSVKPDDYPFKLHYTEPGKAQFKDETGQVYFIEDATQPLFQIRDRINVTSKEVPHLSQTPEIETTVGNLIQNYVLLVYPFGSKIEYINQRFTPSDIEKIVEQRKSITTPVHERDRDPNLIYFDEYDRYCDACIHLTNFNAVCVPTLSYRAMTPPPGVAERRQALLEEYKDRLDDPTVMVKISKELEAMDKAYISEDSSSGFFIQNKDFTVIRKRLYLLYGEAKQFSNTDGSPNFIARPLCEGIDYEKLDQYNNDARYGSYSRGAETQLGGVAVKELLRASSNLSIDEQDCGTREGQEFYLTESTAKTLMGFTLITPKGLDVLSEENKGQYLNKTVKVRFPSHCKTSGTGFCATCCGPYLSLHPNGLSFAVSDTGNTLLYVFMKQMHGKEDASIRLDMKRLLS